VDWATELPMKLTCPSLESNLGGIDTPLWNDENPYPHDKGMMIRPEEVADVIAYILAQPKRTLFKNVIFVPVVEEW
jgi:hypothetical protein